MDYYKLLNDYLNRDRDLDNQYEVAYWDDRGSCIEVTYRHTEWESSERMNISLFDLLTFVYSKL